MIIINYNYVNFKENDINIDYIDNIYYYYNYSININYDNKKLY